MDHGSGHQGNPSQQEDSPWPDQQQRYPHSHHGTPAQEYMPYTWSQPQLPYGGTPNMVYSQAPSAYTPGAYDRSPEQTLPPWPSQLSIDHTSAQKMLPVHYHPSVPQPEPFVLPLAATAHAPVSTPSPPRRTLTDDDRRRMCLYAEQHPHLKQTDIGAYFKVDRSTVSKVLRHKEKYLVRDFSSRSPLRQTKSRKSDVERALTSWVEKQRKLDVSLTDDNIRARAATLALASGGDESNPALKPDWLKKFKRKMGLPRKKSLAMSDESDVPTDNDSTESTSPTDPLPQIDTTIGTKGLKEEQNYMKSEHDNKQRSDSLAGGYAQEADFSPQLFPNMSPFLPSMSGDSPLLTQGFSQPPLHPTMEAADRPRRSTFPQATVDPYASSSKHRNVGMLDSPMENYEQTGQVEPSYYDSAPHNSPPTTSLRAGTISPSDTMRAPPLPAQARRTVSYSGSYPGPAGHRPIAAYPSREEARAGLEATLKYIQSQPTGLLDTQENMLLGSVLEKLRAPQDTNRRSKG